MLDGSRTMSVLEAAAVPDRPSYCGVRTERYMFVQYATGERELYDYRTDPFELHNRAGRSRYAATEQALREDAKRLCSPTPPGFSWTL